MKKRNFCIALGLLVVFALWTMAIRVVDVQAIGPRGSTVGFATLNGLFHRAIGVNFALYTITDCWDWCLLGCAWCLRCLVLFNGSRESVF